MSGRANHWYSDEWCRDHHAASQEKLQNIAKMIRENCKVVEVNTVAGQTDDTMVCTIYRNESIGLKYWVKDQFGHISEIDELREF